MKNKLCFIIIVLMISPFLVLTTNVLATPVVYNINISNASASYSLDYLTNISTGLVTYWRLDNNSAYGENANSIYDSAISHYNGSVIGANFTTTGKIGGSYLFSGVNSSINISRDISEVKLTNNFTLTFWVNIADTSSTKLVFNKVRDSGDKLGIDIAPNLIRAQYGNGSNNAIKSSTTMTANKWYFITYSFTNMGGTYGIGNLTLNTIQQTGTSGPTLVNTNATYIGVRTDYTRFMNGSIDDFRIYNYTLSQSEINNLYYTTDPIYGSFDNVTLQANITDPDTALSNLFYQWYINRIPITSGFQTSVFNTLLQEVKSINGLTLINSRFLNTTNDSTFILLTNQGLNSTYNITVAVNSSANNTYINQSWFVTLDSTSNVVNISVAGISNALIRYSNNTIQCPIVTNCDGIYNIILNPANSSLILNEYNFSLNLVRTNDPAFNGTFINNTVTGNITANIYGITGVRNGVLRSGSVLTNSQFTIPNGGYVYVE